MPYWSITRLLHSISVREEGLSCLVVHLIDYREKQCLRLALVDLQNLPRSLIIMLYYQNCKTFMYWKGRRYEFFPSTSFLLTKSMKWETLLSGIRTIYRNTFSKLWLTMYLLMWVMEWATIMVVYWNHLLSKAPEGNQWLCQWENRDWIYFCQLAQHQKVTIVAQISIVFLFSYDTFTLLWQV